MTIRIRKILPILTILTILSLSEALNATNLLHCRDKTERGRVYRCKLQKFQLIPAMPYEIDLRLTYTLGVAGVKLSNLGVIDHSSGHFATFEENGGNIAICGQGPIEVYDKDPSWTHFVHLPADFALTILSATHRPSSQTIKNWKEDLQEKKDKRSLLQRNIALLEKQRLSKRVAVLLHSKLEDTNASLSHEHFRQIHQHAPMLAEWIKTKLTENMNKLSPQDITSQLSLVWSLQEIATLQKASSLKPADVFSSEDRSLIEEIIKDMDDDDLIRSELKRLIKIRSTIDKEVKVLEGRLT